MKKSKGWRNEPLRHSLASKGVKTGRRKHDISVTLSDSTLKAMKIQRFTWFLIEQYGVEDTDSYEVKQLTEQLVNKKVIRKEDLDKYAYDVAKYYDIEDTDRKEAKQLTRIFWRT